MERSGTAHVYLDYSEGVQTELAKVDYEPVFVREWNDDGRETLIAVMERIRSAKHNDKCLVIFDTGHWGWMDYYIAITMTDAATITDAKEFIESVDGTRYYGGKLRVWACHHAEGDTLPIVVHETLINEDREAVFSEEYGPAFTDDTGKLYRYFRSEYGRCTSSVYIDTHSRGTVRHGWVFVKRADYDRSSDSYLQSAWIALSRTVAYQSNGKEILESIDLDKKGKRHA